MRFRILNFASFCQSCRAPNLGFERRFYKSLKDF